MKLFLDVGAHKGQTARAVTASRYAFDQIICFEPATECIPYIESIGDKRITINPFGLWKETRKTRLFGAGDIGASIFKDKAIAVSTKTAEIQLVKASDWMSKNVKADDIVFMKLNCEGSECDILDDLIDSGEIYKIYNIMVDFDVRKIPSMRKREWKTRQKLRKHKIENVCFCENVMIGESHEDRIHNWLDQVGASETLSLSSLREKYGITLHELSRIHRRFGRVRDFCENHFGGSYLYKRAKGLYRRIKGLLRTIKEND